MTNQLKLTDEQTMEIDKMLRKIAFRKKHQYETLSSRISYEDVVSELWIKTIDKINEIGRVDMDLIATCAYGQIVDIVRKEIRRPSTSVDPSRFEYSGSESDVSSDSNGAYIDTEFNNNSIPAPDSALTIKDMLSLFESGSNPEKLLKIVAEYYTNLDKDELGIEEETDFSELCGHQENYFWDFVAKKLGYAGSYSSGLRRVRTKVREALLAAGYNPNN